MTVVYGHALRPPGAGSGVSRRLSTSLSSAGWYAWDVPDGAYRVVVEKSGYKKVVSKIVTAAPGAAGLDISLERDGPCYHFFAEGTTRAGFDEWFCLQNPGDKEANVAITYMLGTGENKTQQVTIPKQSRTKVDVNLFVGPDQDVSAVVSSDRFVVAERPMYFDHQGRITGGHDVVGADAPLTEWSFAEGTTRAGFAEWLCLQNPTDSDADVLVTYMLGTGENKQTTRRVPARSRQTVDVNAEVGPEQDVSATVVSLNGVPIVAERPMYFDYHDKWPGGHDVIGATAPRAAWYFAEGTTRAGFEEWLCLQNPGETAANVNITYMLGSGETRVQRATVEPKSRKTVDVNLFLGAGQDASCMVNSDAPVVAERPIYFNYRDKWTGGHDVVGATCAKDIMFLAEGTTRDGFEEWLCLQNPNDQDTDVEITYMLGTGGEHVPETESARAQQSHGRRRPGGRNRSRRLRQDRLRGRADSG